MNKRLTFAARKWFWTTYLYFHLTGNSASPLFCHFFGAQIDNLYSFTCTAPLNHQPIGGNLANYGKGTSLAVHNSVIACSLSLSKLTITTELLSPKSTESGLWESSRNPWSEPRLMLAPLAPASPCIQHLATATPKPPIATFWAELKALFERLLTRRQ